MRDLYDRRLVVTYSIIVICLLVFIYELVMYPRGFRLLPLGLMRIFIPVLILDYISRGGC